MSNKLYLGSKSRSRRQLLIESKIPFEIIDQSADESQCDWGLPFQKLLESIAVYKMDHAILPHGVKGKEIFVVTADTMGCDSDGNIHGKPTSREDAIAKIKALRGGGVVGTVFCLDKKQHDGTQWVVQQRITKYVPCSYVFNIPDRDIEMYLQETPNYMEISGAITIGGYGAQFLTSLNGSYSTVLGLPLFELRESLHEIGFFN